MFVLLLVHPTPNPHYQHELSSRIPILVHQIDYSCLYTFNCDIEMGINRCTYIIPFIFRDDSVILKILIPVIFSMQNFIMPSDVRSWSL